MYLNGVNDELSTTDTHTIQGRLLVREKEMTERLLGELRQTRIQKIISAAQNRIPIQQASLTEEEFGVLEKINQSLSSLGQLPVQPEKEGLTDELRVVRFLEDIPEIVGVDLRIYGPFKKEDVASLPAPNAHALERQGAAKPIEVRGIS
jgi:DNA replication factor GINS